MNEQEFLARYENDRPIYEAWGEHVLEKILTGLREQPDIIIDQFLKIPPGPPRIKTTNSVLSKAFRRGKEYNDPYNDITDKVGLRFVVLLTTDIERITKIIESFSSKWDWTKDRDYHDEILSKPEHFTYQSVHFIVRNKEHLKIGEVTIPSGTPCEVQIRTLLQHAYSELTHDTTYKPKTKTNPMVSRYIARSMALVESADHFFLEVVREIKETTEKHEQWKEFCKRKYPGDLHDYVEAINHMVVDALFDLLQPLTTFQVDEYLHNMNYFSNIVLPRQELSLMHRQPVILLIYYFIKHNRTLLKSVWPLTDDILRSLFSDMGIAYGE